MNQPFDSQKAIETLTKEGWTRKTSSIWKSPWGALYLGPAFALKVMQAVKDNPICPYLPRGRDHA